MTRFSIALTLLLASGCVRDPSTRAVSPLGEPAAANATNEADDPAADLGPDLARDPGLAPLLPTAAQRRLQILVAVPDESAHTVHRFAFRADAEYFYPASAVKLCTAVAALEKLDELRSERADLSPSTPLRVTTSGDRPVVLDTTLREELERSLVLSDNDAFNRLLDFVGKSELAERMSRLGLSSARIVHRLGDATDAPAPSFELLGARSVFVAQRVGFEPPLSKADGMLVGSAYVDENGRVVDSPFDFGAKNRISLRDLQELLIAVTRPDLTETPPPAISPADRTLLLDILGTRPSELPSHPPASLDAMHKPMLAPIAEVLPDHDVRAYGKGGRAYGFTVENALVVDRTTRRSVFVTATIYANDNDTLNDDNYAYATVADPFVAELGRFVAKTYLR